MVAIGVVLAGAAAAPAADTGAVVRAQAILDRVIANRPARDFSLQGRLIIARDESAPLKLLVKILPQETRAIYRTPSMDLLVVQPVGGEARFFLKGRGELTGESGWERLLGSAISYHDLGLPFLHWPNPKLIGQERTRGRDCDLIDVTADQGPYRRVRMWIDQEYQALMRADAFNENNDPVKRFAVGSVKRIQQVWVPSSLEFARVPPGQALPAQEKSRLEFNTGEQNQDFPAEWFQPEKFGQR